MIRDMNTITLKLYIIIISLCLLACTTVVPRQKETYATMIGSSTYRNGPQGIYEYYVDGKKFKHIGHYDRDYVKGEKFKILYDSLHPAVDYWSGFHSEKPIFLPSEHTEKVIGTIIDIGRYSCLFKYYYKFSDNTIQIKNHDPYYIRSQYIGLPKDYKTSRPDLKVGAQFLVEYWKDDYRRAIIYLDVPVTDKNSVREPESIDSLEFIKDKLNVTKANIVTTVKEKEGEVNIYTGEGKGDDRLVEFKINTFTGSCRKLEHEVQKDFYKAHKVKLIESSRGAEISGDKFFYKQVSGIIKIEGNCEIIKGSQIIKTSEITINVNSRVADYKKDGLIDSIILF
jgi:hypothetical protein